MICRWDDCMNETRFGDWTRSGLGMGGAGIRRVTKKIIHYGTPTDANWAVHMDADYINISCRHMFQPSNSNSNRQNAESLTPLLDIFGPALSCAVSEVAFLPEQGATPVQLSVGLNLVRAFPQTIRPLRVHQMVVSEPLWHPFSKERTERFREQGGQGAVWKFFAVPWSKPTFNPVEIYE